MPPAGVRSSSRPGGRVEPDAHGLWNAYRDTGSDPAREELILHYAPLVKYVAGRVGVGLPNNIEHGDLVSYGMFGLIDAIQRFDLDKGVKFETYAITRIKGAIIDELRSIDWVPRSVRTKARNVAKAMQQLEGRLKRTPTDEELADELDVSLADLHQTLEEISFTSVAALDDALSVGGDTISLIDTIEDTDTVTPEENVDEIALRSVLIEAVDRLTDREQQVIALYYFEGLTLAQVGEILGVTESRVCQIHTKAVLSLRSKMFERISG
ncbi:MAG: RNA polymerase sigma factor WhiG [Nitriliruptorales bacterium]